MAGVLLDWINAVDMARHDQHWEAKAWHGAPAGLTAAICSLHGNPLDRVSQGGQDSWGMRHGCPLSPCIFVASMSAMWVDAWEVVRRQGGRTGVWELDFGELLYADDTAMVVGAGGGGKGRSALQAAA